MSKIGNYYLELQEQANELGFDTVEDAFDAGYEAYMGKLQPKEDEQTKAHEAWLEEKNIVLGDLKNLLICKAFDFDIIKHAIEFIEKGEQ